jgi:hypothetical protein
MNEKTVPDDKGYWWCPECKEELGWYHVTCQEKHETCGTSVIWKEIDAAPESELAPKAVPVEPIGEVWPGGISNGLVTPCGICGVVPKFDYNVTDEFWNEVAPAALKCFVICLPCLDRLAGGLPLGEHLLSVQFTGAGKTIVLTPTKVYTYATPRSRGL